MKKLTWALLSLMLFLGLGAASAQTLPKPAINPASGASVPPGAKIDIILPEEGMEYDKYMVVVVLYVENDNETVLTTDMATLTALVQASMGIGGGPEVDEEGKTEAGYKTATYFIDPDDSDSRMWMNKVAISAKANGPTTLRMRLVTAKYGGGNTLFYSDEFGADYTVDVNAPAPKVAAPTITLGEDGMLSMENVYGDQLHPILYKVNGTDADFESITIAMLENGSIDDMMYTAPITYTEGQTVKAVTMEIDIVEESISLSDIVTYPASEPEPEPVVPPVAPTFNPNGGEVTLDQQISLATTSEGVSIYYTMESEMIPDFSTITTEEDLEEASMFMLYDDDDKITLGNFIFEEDLADGDVQVTLMAAAAVIKDGNVTWSTTTKAPFTVKGIEPPAGEVAQPVITPDGSDGHATIKLSEKVTITCATNDASIYYTLDGSTPDATKTLYEAPFLLPANTPVGQEITIRAIAIKDGVSSDPRRVALMVEAAGEDPEPETVAKPTFEPAAGEVPFGTMVELYCETPDATIYFTIDGTEPTKDNGEEYSWMSEILITKAMTVKAVAYNGDAKSELAEAAYTVAPVHATLSITSPMLGDTVGKNVGVGLSISDPENPSSQMWMYTNPADVYYTIDGTTVPSKAAYEAQADKANGAIKKISTQADEDGYIMTDADGNALSVVFSEDIHLKAIGYMTMDGEEIATSVLDKELKVKALENPTFSITDYTKVAVGDKLVIKNPAPAPEEAEEGEEGEEGGEEFGGNAGEEVTAVPVGTIYFSFDGTKPTRVAYEEQDADWELERPYSTYKVFKVEEGKDLEITFGQDEEGYYAYVPVITDVLYFPGYDTIRLGEDGHFNVDVWCMASIEAGMNPLTGWPMYFNYGSDFVNGAYTLKDDFIIPDPAFTPAAGEVEKGTKVELSCTTNGAKIYYTVDGSEPTAESTQYKEAIEIVKDMTVKAIAIRGAFQSKVAEAAYTVMVVAKPAFNPAAGEVEKGTKVELSCATKDAKIYYTVDGSEPTAESAEYTTAIEINAAMTVKAIAIKGNTKSEVAEAAYTVKTANEGEELAGVTVYPNPSNGLFNIELPVSATIEVFMSNGMLYQRVKAAAGNATLNIERSGIYFLRITGEGRTTIKRVIVR